MPLVTTKEMFKKALDGNYAIGAFNINNMEILQGVVNAAKAKNSPVIIQVSTGALKYAGPKYLKAMVDAAVEDTGIDVALHLDRSYSIVATFASIPSLFLLKSIILYFCFAPPPT